jgi:hypothetical protein
LQGFLESGLTQRPGDETSEGTLRELADPRCCGST